MGCFRFQSLDANENPSDNITSFRFTTAAIHIEAHVAIRDRVVTLGDFAGENVFSMPVRPNNESGPIPGPWPRPITGKVCGSRFLPLHAGRSAGHGSCRDMREGLRVTVPAVTCGKVCGSRFLP
jgi:hypothetical protein